MRHTFFLTHYLQTNIFVFFLYGGKYTHFKLGIHGNCFFKCIKDYLPSGKASINECNELRIAHGIEPDTWIDYRDAYNICCSKVLERKFISTKTVEFHYSHIQTFNPGGDKI